MDCTRSPGRYIRRGLVVLFTFLSSVVCRGETASIELDNDRIVKGERFTLQIRTGIPWGEEVIIERPELDGPMVWWAYPYARSWTATSEDGGSIRLVEVLASIRVDEPGFHSLAPFRIKAGDQEAVTPLVEVIGLEPDERGLPYPVNTAWRSVPESVWQGQAVPVVLEARNLASLAFAESAVLASAPQGLLEEAPGLGGILTRSHGKDILYDIPVASWIWTQETAGESVFPAVSVNVAGLNRSSPAFTIQVKNLPEAARESGAVGQFRLNVNVEDGPYHQGEVVSVRIRVEGEGNMNVLNLPVPQLEGATLVGQGSSSSYLPSPEGFEGWREERFDFQIDRAGDLQLQVPRWVWLDPSGSGSLVRAAPEAQILEALESPVDADAGSRLNLFGHELFRYKASAFNWRQSHWFLLALPGFIVLVVAFLLKRPRLKTTAALMVLPLLISSSNLEQDFLSQATLAATVGNAGNWDSAYERYASLYDDMGEMPGLLHDLAISALETGRPDTAVYSMRRALHLRPGSSVMASQLRILESKLGLDDQVPVPFGWPPWAVFTLFLIGINGIFLALARLLYRRNTQDILIFVAALFLLLMGSFGVLYSNGLWDRPTAVVAMESQPLRKIPGPLATDWIKLPAGTAVRVLAVEGSDILVRTGYGLEGWLTESSLISVSEEYDGF